MTTPEAPGASTEPAWTRRRLWTFRIGVSFFAIQIARVLLDTTAGMRALDARLAESLEALLSALAPGLAQAWTRLAARGDGHAVVLGLLGEGLLALLGALAWSLCDRRRQHQRLAGRVRLSLRYLVAVVMLVYGGLKVVPVQFPVPSAESLLRPLGEQSRMALLWAFMGVSPAYVVFAGLGESIGATLLFWRRTTTLGALILAGVMANVVMLNFAYDVPVKRGAALLFLAAMVLASRDASRLARVFLLDRHAPPGGEPAFRAGPVLRRVRAVLKPTIVVLAVAAPMAAALAGGVWRSRSSGPLRGVYTVERFVHDGVEVPPSRAESTRWRRVVLGDRGGAVVQRMDDSLERLGLAIDEQARTLRLSSTSHPELTFRYEGGDAGQPLRLVSEGPSLQELVLTPIPESTLFRVLD